MQSLKWFIGGSIGGAIGAAIWVAVGYFASFEVGWIAWGVGGLVGLGVRAAAGETDGPAPGVVAGATAVIAVLVAKFLVVSLLVSNAFDEAPIPTQFTPEQMIARHATDVADEYEAAGKKLNWPPGHDSEDVPLHQSYPAAVWAEGQKRWQALSPEQQQAEMEQAKADLENMLDNYETDVRNEAFSESFSPLDLLWFGLAAFTAFKIGSGLTNDE